MNTEVYYLSREEKVAQMLAMHIPLKAFPNPPCGLVYLESVTLNVCEIECHCNLTAPRNMVGSHCPDLALRNSEALGNQSSPLC